MRRRLRKRRSQLREAAGILELNPGIDRGYIEHWASRLGAAGLWQQVGPSR
jgi:hypothetical protein